MGKGNRTKNKTSSTTLSSSTTSSTTTLPSVSIHTVSNGSRVNFLSLLIQMILNQDYTNIKEWIIADGSKLKEESEFLQKHISDVLTPKLLESHSEITIKYVPWEDNSTLAAVRQRANTACSSEYIVCMDDDDYYPVCRVSHAIRRMQNTRVSLAGCSNMMVYDCNMRRIFQFPAFGPNHSTHNAFAYTKAFANTHSYDTTLHFAEEKKFLNDYAEPMVQLEPDKTVLQIAHSDNTVEKKQLLLRYFTAHNNREREMAKIPILLSTRLDQIVKESVFREYYDSLYPESECDADIVYYTGGMCITWDPRSPTLTGSEQAIRHLSQEWAKLGKKVIVYANLETDELDYNGVHYRHWSHFRFRDSYKILILWRWSGLFGTLDLDVKAKHLWVDFHDNVPDMYKYAADQIHKIETIYCKSNYHKEEILKHVRNKDKVEPKIKIIPNGLRVEGFRSPPVDTPARNPYRFCYCSCYTRGLQHILERVWPVIYKMQPKAELHCYYGLESIRDENFKNHLRLLLAQPGVMDHGRQSMEMVAREKYMSNFHFYWTTSPAEIDCISIRESLLTGCIPILSNFGVFKERDGIHLDTLPTTDDEFQKTARIILQIMSDNTRMNDIRSKLRSSKTILSWADVAIMYDHIVPDYSDTTSEPSLLKLITEDK